MWSSLDIRKQGIDHPINLWRSSKGWDETPKDCWEGSGEESPYIISSMISPARSCFHPQQLYFPSREILSQKRNSLQSKQAHYFKQTYTYTPFLLKSKQQHLLLQKTDRYTLLNSTLHLTATTTSLQQYFLRYKLQMKIPSIVILTITTASASTLKENEPAHPGYCRTWNYSCYEDGRPECCTYGSCYSNRAPPCDLGDREVGDIGDNKGGSKEASHFLRGS